MTEGRCVGTRNRSFPVSELRLSSPTGRPEAHPTTAAAVRPALRSSTTITAWSPEGQTLYNQRGFSDFAISREQTCSRRSDARRPLARPRPSFDPGY
jgi:hypothetical protein